MINAFWKSFLAQASAVMAGIIIGTVTGTVVLVVYIFLVGGF